MAINRDKVSASAIKHLQSGKFDRAIGELQKLVEDDPKDVRTLLKLGDTYVKVGRRDDAIASYQAVADVYSEQGFYLKAVAVFKQMLRVDGNLPAVHLQLAEMYQQLGLHSDCMQHFQQVAVYYERQGDLAKTLDVLKKMVDLDPDNLYQDFCIGNGTLDSRYEDPKNCRPLSARERYVCIICKITICLKLSNCGLSFLQL